MSRSTHWRRGPSTVVALLMLGVASAVLAEPESDVSALEAKCEAARAAQIKPLREAEITKCKADRRNDPEYCERYWSDYGNARRLPNGTMSVRMFDNLPICVTAANARKALSASGQ